MINVRLVLALATFLLAAPANGAGADIDNDGLVDNADLQLMRAAFFTDDPAADLDGDGRVDFADLAILRNAYAAMSMLPDPVKRTRGPVLPTVTLLPATQGARIGDTVLIEVWVDFSAEPALGGGFDIFYDETVLEYVEFTFGPDYSGDPDFSRPPDDLPGGLLNGLAVGNFFDGIVGPEQVGTLSFIAVDPGGVDLTMADNVWPAGSFISFATGLPLTVDYIGANVTVEGTVVATPASIDFGAIFGEPAQENLALNNLSPSAVTVGQIAALDPLESPFSIAFDGCSLQVLQPGEGCEITLEFDSNITEEFGDTFDIPLEDSAVPSITIEVQGSSTQTVAVDILPAECPNLLLLDEPAFIHVTIVGTPQLNANSIDPASIRLNNVAPRRSFSVDLATPYLPFIGKENPEDCNDLGPDGFKDLLLLFDYRELRDSLASAQTGDVEVLRLTGQHIVVYPVANDGQWRFVGEDVVVIQRDP